MPDLRSKNFEKYKGYYEAGYWTIDMLRNVVEKSKLTKAEFEEITGKECE